MLVRLKHLLIGSPLPTQQLAHERLSKFQALAAFSPDALSSIAYANQEIYLGLAAAGAAGLVLAWPIGLTIVFLLAVVALSYYQTIAGYPGGGGSYGVARENLGLLPGLVTAAALLIDYLLTAAVSLTAGVEALASAFPALWPYRIHFALGILLIITLANLHGAQESGRLMAVPVYFFLITYLSMLVYGVYRAAVDGPISLQAVAPAAAQPVTLYLLLHTFATGCTALTGIEAISNGVPAFKPPSPRNAQKTLVIMAVLMGLLFAGSIGLTQYFAITAAPPETILSALARHLLGDGTVAYFVIQVSTLLVLAVAANTSFAGFPRLVAILARENLMPRQLTHLGDRLVFNNGIILLTAGTAVLILLFGGVSHALIPLFAVGVFLAYTFSQTGMVLHWRKVRGPGWHFKAAANGLGAVVTCITLLIVGYSKFLEGAWISVFLIPFLVYVFLQIRKRYNLDTLGLSLAGLPPDLRPFPTPRVVVPISGVHRGMFDAVNFARSLSPHVTALYIELEPNAGERIRKDWQAWFPDVALDIVPSPYRSIIGPLLAYLDQVDEAHNDGQLAMVVLPEIVPARWWHSLLHNQMGWLIKAALLYKEQRNAFPRVIINIPYRLKR